MPVAPIQPGLESMNNHISAGRPIRSIRSTNMAGNFLTANDVPVGKRIFQVSPTVNQIIPNHQAQHEVMKGGKRIEPPLMIKANA